MYSHLHAHSCYSFLEGLPSPVELARAAARLEMPALALTDHLGLTGALAFYRACRAEGVQPILGLEVDLLLPYQLSASRAQGMTGSLVLLAASRGGWSSLCRLSSELLLRADGQPPTCTLDDLADCADGLICLTGGCRGAPQRLLEQSAEEALQLLGRLKEIFPGRLYVELSSQLSGSQPMLPDATNETLAGLAEHLHLPLAAAHCIHYLEPDQADLQRTLAAIRLNCTLGELPPGAAAPPGAYFLSLAEMERRFASYPQALAAPAEIAARCAFDLELGRPHYPQVPLPPGMSAIALLRQKAEAGAVRLYGGLTPPVAQRLESELAVIAARGYEPIFLIAEEMIAYAHDKGVPSASRGSASSSLVAHCIGITTPDPLALDLYFERFLNPARTTPPDIDTDFCSRRRDDVIRHLFEPVWARPGGHGRDDQHLPPALGPQRHRQSAWLPTPRNPRPGRAAFPPLPPWPGRKRRFHRIGKPSVCRAERAVRRRPALQAASSNRPAQCSGCPTTFPCIPAGW